MEIKAVDLFCGIGGLTYGLQRAGIQVVGGIDIDEGSITNFVGFNISYILLSAHIKQF